MQVSQVVLTSPAEDGGDEEESAEKDGLHPLAHVRNLKGEGEGREGAQKERGRGVLLTGVGA